MTIKGTPTVFLQVVVVLIGLVALIVLIRLPQLEGRAQGLDLISIYSDPFILYGYTASIAFFVALYKAFKVLGYIRHNKLFSLESVKTLRSIKHCALILVAAIVLAGLYVMLFVTGEDSAGFISLCIISIFISFAVAAAMAVLERILQNAVDMKTENDLTI
jgi:hypothetical protein